MSELANQPAASAVRDFNEQVIVVGPPGHGKTTIVRGEVLGHLNTHPAGRAFVHDVNRQFSDMCVCYDDVAAYKRAAHAAAAAKTKLPHGASIGGSARELTEFVMQLGRAHNTAGAVRMPLLLAYDESSLMDTSGSTFVDRLDSQLIANRRHMGIKPIYNVQRPTMLTEAFYTQATTVYILAQPSERKTRQLEEYLGLPDNALRALVGAGKFKFLMWRSGEGLVDPRTQQPSRQLGGA